MEETAKYSIENVDVLSPVMGELDDLTRNSNFEKLRKALRITEHHYYRLKERYTHEPETRVGIAEDWLHYTAALSEIKEALDFKIVSSSDDPDGEYYSSIKEPIAIKEEIEKKFNNLLGIESEDRDEMDFWEHY